MSGEAIAILCVGLVLGLWLLILTVYVDFVSTKADFADERAGRARALADNLADALGYEVRDEAPYVVKRKK